jgi:NAD dependent epimerase/dehydratase family enzyme
MLPAFKLGGGGRIGSGRQFVSWVGIDDACAAIVHALCAPRVEGPVNVVAPVPVTNLQMTRALGRMLKRPTLAQLPSAAARILFGEMADELLLSSTRVVPGKLEETGFVFRHPRLDEGLDHLLGRVAR